MAAKVSDKIALEAPRKPVQAPSSPGRWLVAQDTRGHHTVVPAWLNGRANFPARVVLRTDSFSDACNRCEKLNQGWFGDFGVSLSMKGITDRLSPPRDTSRLDYVKRWQGIKTDDEKYLDWLERRYPDLSESERRSIAENT